MTRATLDALAFVQITGVGPKGIHIDTYLAVLEHVEVGAQYNRILKASAPDVAGTKLARTHAALTEAGYFYNGLPYRHGKGRGTSRKNRLQYLRGADDPILSVGRSGTVWAHNDVDRWGKRQPRPEVTFAVPWKDGVPESWAARRSA